ncbi:aldehyde dehydrogenase family protein [Actinomadura sp. NAK00032]|uniref:aldehyde dehydrogenase family protein n=1 Tax=Actinomadura sp. NAK00032 TaxID=2742128 RepID=UPI001C37AA0E|nr:aldehyde dehydrogenase family protein [Actinomadura sp. NAK00032]
MGVEYAGTADAWGQVTNPATGRVTGKVALASEADAAHVIQSSARAATGWGNTSLARRTTSPFTSGPRCSPSRRGGRSATSPTLFWRDAGLSGTAFSPYQVVHEAYDNTN